MRKLTSAGLLLLAFSLSTQRALPFWPEPALVRSAYFLEDLSPKERLENFETAWRTIRDTYYDPAMNGVDWNQVHARYLPLVQAAGNDQELYDLLERMAAELHDAHTHVLSPTQAENFRHHERVSLGFNAQTVEGKIAVTRVRPDSDAARAGVQPGMTIETIDGKPLAEKLGQMAAEFGESSSERATIHVRLAHALMGEAGTSITLGLERADGSHFDVTIKRTVEELAPKLSATRLPSGNAYISFHVFYPPAAHDFQEALQPFHEAPGLIIDLRHNPGGSSDQLLSIAGNFFSGKTELARGRLRGKESVPAYAMIDHKASAYTGPVVVLVDEQSGSSSELFTAGMQTVGRVKVVGTRTCGCVLGTAGRAHLKGGGEVMVSRVLWSTPAGRKLEGEGVIPDKLVPLTLADLRSGRDAALEEADKLLKEMSPPPAAQKSANR